MWGSPSLYINTDLQTSDPLSRPVDVLEAWKVTQALVSTWPSALHQSWSYVMKRSGKMAGLTL